MRFPAVTAAGIVVGLIAGVGDASAGVAGVTVTGSDGTELSLTGAQTIRNLEPTVRLSPFAGSTQYFTVAVSGPDGGEAASAPCTRLSGGLPVGYRGNGSYTVLVTSFNTSTCEVPVGPVQSFGYTQAARIDIAAPPGRVLFRGMDAPTVTPVPVTLTPAPGGSPEVRYQKTGSVDPATGEIIGGGSRATVASDGRSAGVVVREPGRYVVVARQLVSSPRLGTFGTPWSAPVVFQAVAPFDLRAVSFPDRRGPDYQFRGVVREPSAVGSVVTVAIARGRSAGRYRTVRRVQVRSGGSFTARFRAVDGRWRIRVKLPQTETINSGSQIRSFTVRRGRLEPER